MSAVATAPSRGGKNKSAAVDEDAKQYEDGPIGRAEKLADEKNDQADELTEAGDDEGAQIARIEADEQTELARSLRLDEGDSKAGELRKEAGEPVGEMPPGELPEDPDIAPESIVVAGIEMEYPDMGGKRPDRASLSLQGGRVMLVDGTALPKGTRIKFSGEAVVVGAGQHDTTDTATKQVTHSEQKHTALISDLRIEVPGK